MQQLGDPLVARLQIVVGEHGGNGDEQAERGHDQRFADRAGDLVDRSRTGDADIDQRAVDADHRTEQADERRGRTGSSEERQARSELCVDRRFRTRERAVQPVMRFETVGHLLMLFFGDDTVVDDLAPGGVLLQLGGAFLEAVGLPEISAKFLVLAHDLALFEPFGEQDEERAEAHDRQDDHGRIGDGAALLERFPETEGVFDFFALGGGG